MTLKERFSPENTEAKLRAKIEKEFGKDHNIKTALFKAVSEYNDEYDNYNPILILIDKDFNEVEHNINVDDLCPNEDDQGDFYEENNYNSRETLSVDDLTIKF